LAKGKSFIASGAILRSISTHGNPPLPPVGSHVLHPENGGKIPWEISGEFQPWKSSSNFRVFQPFQPLNFGRVGAVETPQKKDMTYFLFIFWKAVQNK